jgi:hypothetical protein
VLANVRQKNRAKTGAGKFCRTVEGFNLFYRKQKPKFPRTSEPQRLDRSHYSTKDLPSVQDERPKNISLFTHAISLQCSHDETV